ncbi:MAG: ribonuclease P protein component [Flavobacteriaceae bacterium]|nr:MAG: ribonuclease P protein component [Flavobacteriaceae bacterium]
MKFTLGKYERLKSKKLITQLFEEGRSLKIFPLRLAYLQTEHTSGFPVQVGFSVSKKQFKKAVDRNRIRRLIKEAYRHEKYTVYDVTNATFMITFIGKKKPIYADIQKSMSSLLKLFLKELKQ